ncbi:MAG: phosphopantetheine-binding protein, partial [Acidobacteriota bacterium]
LPDGNIENVGRRDFQVKIRGFRIELGEIEAALARFPSIRDCALKVDTSLGDEKRLVAYLVCEEGRRPGLSELRAYLMEHLPGYMMPSAFVFLEALPLTANGKLDRKALPAPDRSRAGSGTEYVAPATPTEKELAQIWTKILLVEQVGAQDNFFESGGHSLLATQLVSHIRESFSVELPLRTIFESPVLAQLAAVIDATQAEIQPEMAELSQLLDSLEDFSEDQIRALLEDRLGEESQARVFSTIGSSSAGRG